MDVPFFVSFTLIALLSRYVPFALPPMARDLLADNSAEPARAAKCAVSVAVAGMVLLVSLQCGAGGEQYCPDIKVEGRALWLNCAALFLGMVVGGVAVVLPPFAAVSPLVQVAVEHLTMFTETIAVTAFAHDFCIFVKLVRLKH
ncbi:hypothetical protein E2562_009366 [Oryza meyeriana var. granulata]|uniref:Uncharacterized protein n=1 Tax=Oryza meyeriana var. granulata TaxID=110450 RepID=A0A6G1CFC5_9ORYZ|nr:hypothetical protein E2562_009366 [Oryza meyeriana var. granulata]